MMRGSTAASDAAALAWQQEQQNGGAELVEARQEAAVNVEASFEKLVDQIIAGSGIMRCARGFRGLGADGR
jgi:hypothetical protein